MLSIVGHEPNPRDGRVGFWTRDEVVAMNNRALARLAFCHPERCPPEMKLALHRLARKRGETTFQPPESPLITAEEVLSELFGSLPDCDPAQDSEFHCERMYVETAKVIRNAIAAKYGLTTTDLDSECRNKKLVRARHEAMYLICLETTLSYPRIGRMFGGKDHTTVRSAVIGHACRNGLTAPRGLGE